MINPTAKSVGRQVLYQSHAGAQEEVGWVTSMNHAFVFVRYNDQPSWGHGRPTLREDLRWFMTPRKLP